jgi:hypothetical protein
LKTAGLHRVIVATVLCMASVENERKQTGINFLLGAAENAESGGG